MIVYMIFDIIADMIFDMILITFLKESFFLIGFELSCNGNGKPDPDWTNSIHNLPSF